MVKLNMSPLASMDLHPAVFNDRKRCPQKSFQHVNIKKKKQYYHGFFLESELDKSHKHKMDLRPNF